MKFIRARVLLFFLLLGFAAWARADVIVDNLSQTTANYYGPIGNDANSSDFLIGQEFTFAPGPSPYQIDAITLLLAPGGSSGNITVSLWNVDGNNNPSNEIAALPSVKVGKAGAVSFVPTNNIILEPGMYYVVAAPTAPTDSGLVSWAFTTSSNWDGSGTLNSFADKSRGYWTNFNFGEPQQMSVLAETVTASINSVKRKTNVTTLAWLSVFGGFVADSTTNLLKPVWQVIANAPTTSGATNIVTNSWSGPMQFYRLHQSWVVNNLAQPGTAWNPIGNDNNENDFQMAQEFTLPAGTNVLNKVTLGLVPINGGGHVTATLWTVGGDGNPGTQIATVASSVLVTSPADVDFIPSTTITLTAGDYYVVVNTPSSLDNRRVGWYFTQSLGWTGFGTMGSTAVTILGGWENFSFGSVDPFQMSVQVSPSP